MNHLRALPLTFVIYVVEAVLAVFASFPVGVELVPRLAEPLLDPAHLRELGTLARGFARAHGLSALALLALAPWLQVSWLSIIAEPQSPWRALARGARSLPRAWLVSLGVGLSFLCCAAPWVGLAYGIQRWLGDSPDRRRTDLALLAALLPLVPVAFYFHVVHDLARAASLELHSVRSIGRALRVGLRPTAWAAALIATVAGLSLPLAAHLCGWRLGALPATMLLQCALFVRLMVRGSWLGHALACVNAVPSRLAGKNDE